MMAELENIKWSELKHAYGSAENTPILLRALELHPAVNDNESEPYFSLWSALCHQGDIYSASLAAFPFLVDYCNRNPTNAHWSILQLAVCIETARLNAKDIIQFPEGIKEDYLASKQKILETVAAMMHSNSSDELAIIGISAIAVSRDYGVWSEALQEFTPSLAPKFLHKFYEGDFDA